MQERMLRQMCQAEAEAISVISKHTKAIYLALVAIISITSLVTIAFGTSDADAIEDGVKNGTEKIYGVMTAIIAPIAVVILAWCGFKALFYGERGMEQAKNTALKVVAVIALIYLAPLIVMQIRSWFSDAGNAGIFN